MPRYICQNKKFATSPPYPLPPLYFFSPTAPPPLSFSGSRGKLSAILDFTLDPTDPSVAVGDKTSVIGSVAGNGYGRSLAWSKCTRGSAWGQLMTWFPGGGGFDVTSLVSSLSAPFQTSEYAAAVSNSFGPSGALRSTMLGALHDYNAAYEAVGRGILWVSGGEKASTCQWLATQ